MIAHEVNFDGLVGPTHHYGGLSYGNLASSTHEFAVSNPKEAALQGLEKMRVLMNRGFKQGVIPPHERPAVEYLRAWGFRGTDSEVLAQVAKSAPQMLAQVCSASPMWTANAATVSPSADTADGRVHFTIANLHNKLHRSIEHPTTFRLINAIFSDRQHFAVHPALHSAAILADEGAANHNRLCRTYGQAGVEFFVYGIEALAPQSAAPKKFPARQTREASECIARMHGINPQQVVFAQQHPQVIDLGVFHNDVIAVANRNVLLYHEQAFWESAQVIGELTNKLSEAAQTPLIPLCINQTAVSVEEAVSSYVFNSQLLSIDHEKMLLVVPGECQQTSRVWQTLQELQQSDNPIQEILVQDVKQSMQNGGGPACLRLRVVLNAVELEKMNKEVLLTPERHDQLVAWVKRHYRDRLTVKDLTDKQLLRESRQALDELTQLFALGSIYPFQLN